MPKRYVALAGWTIAYPYGIYRLFRAVLPRRSWWFFYLTLGLPLTLGLTGEVLIELNELVLGEQADFRLTSDFKLQPVPELRVPGAPARSLASDRPLVERFSPVLIQRIANHPQWDIPAALDFDGNDDPRDNVLNEPKFRPLPATVYGEVTAETDDSYYLTYCVYHVKDYDHPVREAISRWTYHDNDNEGFHLRVDKATGALAEVETWFHNRFLVCNFTGRSTGTEPVQGKLQVEGGTHPIIYVQSQGHGIRCAQSQDEAVLKRHTKILRFQGDGPRRNPRPDGSAEIDDTYVLHDFSKWYRYAAGPLERGSGGYFEEAIDIGRKPDGKLLRVGRFIAGLDYAVGTWSRPKPPWSWDDGWDEIPILVWHFYPSRAFESHAGTKLSHHYLHNAPVESIFHEDANRFYQWITLPVKKRGGQKWATLFEQGDPVRRGEYLLAVQKLLRWYVNYLFQALG